MTLFDFVVIVHNLITFLTCNPKSPIYVIIEYVIPESPKYVTPDPLNTSSPSALNTSSPNVLNASSPSALVGDLIQITNNTKRVKIMNVHTYLQSEQCHLLLSNYQIVLQSFQVEVSRGFLTHEQHQ